MCIRDRTSSVDAVCSCLSCVIQGQAGARNRLGGVKAGKRGGARLRPSLCPSAQKAGRGNCGNPLRAAALP
eukprot:7450880-Pyramimonas_sp.AAC.1